MTLVDNTILITGGATGIGLALASQLADDNSVIICSRQQSALDRACRAVPSLITRQCDITRGPERQQLVAWLTEEHPGLNVLINNAGIQIRLDFANRPDAAAIEQEIATNLVAPLALSAALIPYLARQAQGLIINVSSGLGFCPMAAIPVYCATKAALHSFSLSLRWQLKDVPIRVVEFVPPIVATDLAGTAPSARGSAEGPPVISAQAFAREALARLAAGEDEIAVGLAEGLRIRREAMFAVLNG